MKLIDLLVQELPKRGGWPEGAEIAVQDADSQICFSSHSDFSRGKVIAYGNQKAFIEHWSSKNEFVQSLDNIEFRPLRTEEERKRDVAIEAIDRFMPECITDTPNEFYNATKIYDAIAAGKIPGVKLDD
jgi:hypothetical protein